MGLRPVIWVGIDAGKTSHHACAVDDQGRVCWSQKLPNDQAAIEQLIIRARGTAGEVRWAIDLTSSAAALLLAVLVTNGQQVVYVPGRVVNRMSGVFRGEAKTDAKDAHVIAETARLRRDLAAVSAPDELVVELTRLTGHRADLMADWVRGINRLRDLLTSIFPALERAFDYSTRSALILVAGFPTPDAVRDAGAAGLTQHLLDHGVRGTTVSSMVDKALAAAATQTVRLPGEATTATLVGDVARQLLDLDRQIKNTTKLITERFRTHAQAEIIESLPGLGPLLGAEFLVATGGDLAAFATSGRLASYAGPGTGAAGLRTRHREPAAAHPLQPPPPPRVLHGSAVQPEDRRPVAHLLPAQTRRTADPHPGRCWRWPAAWSTCCGRCCATTENSHSPHQQPSKRLDTIIEIRPRCAAGAPRWPLLSCRAQARTRPSSGHQTVTLTRPFHIRRSSGAPTSSASFPTPRPCCGWPAPCWPRPTTNGRPPTAATSPKPPWPYSLRRPRRRKE